MSAIAAYNHLLDGCAAACEWFGNLAGFFEFKPLCRAVKNSKPLEKPLEIADHVFCPHKKITSRSIRISGVLIVII
jgi:hypothetical protein